MKNKLNLLVVMALAITTILFGKATPLYAATEKRTTLSNTYIDYWELNNKPGTYMTENMGEQGVEAKIGDRVSFQYQHPYYRGLQTGEKLIDVKVLGGTMGNISSTQFDDTHYATWGGVNYARYQSTLKDYIDTSATATVNGQINNGSNPIANIKVMPKLLGPNDAEKLKDIKYGVSTGYRTRAVFIVEWTIELAPNNDPELQVQYYDSDTGDSIKQTDRSTVTMGSTVSKTAPDISGYDFLDSTTSTNNGGSWTTRQATKTRNLVVNGNAIIRFYYKKKPDTGMGYEVTVQYYSKSTDQSIKPQKNL